MIRNASNIEAFPYRELDDGSIENIGDWGIKPSISDPIINDVIINGRFTAEEWSPLHLAIALNDYDSTKLLLMHGAKADLKKVSSVIPGHAPLHVAARYGNPDIMKILIEFVTGNVNISDNYGMTPLHYAVCRGHTRCAKLLLDTGASALSKSTFNMTPLDVALVTGNSEIMQLLNCAADTEQRRVLLQSWLVSLNCGQYYTNFLASGYDDIEFIASQGITEADLDCINIPSSQLGLRRKLLALHNISKFVNVSGETQNIDSDRTDESANSRSSHSSSENSDDSSENESSDAGDSNSKMDSITSSSSG